MCLHTGKANEVRAETESSALAGRDRDGGRERVKESERGKRRNTDREDLTVRGLLGVEDENRDERNYEALYGILEY